MYFEESYFQGEEREGFFVEEMMKRAWAAQIEVLLEIDRICDKYGLKYCAGYGTMLGAVRHHGFIPWDDDMDIYMLRDDYEKFLSVVRQETPKNYALLNNYLDKGFSQVFSRLVNTKRIDLSEEHMKKFHGCPYAVGVDIFPLDFLSRNENQVMLQCEMYRLVLSTKTCILKKQTENLDEYLDAIEDICGLKVDRDAPLVGQLIRILDRISAMFHRDESDEVVILHSYVNGFSKRMSKEWFANPVRIPFECIQIPVPSDYHQCLCRIYGPKYMTPVKWFPHDYPFYKGQEEILRAAMQEQNQ